MAAFLHRGLRSNKAVVIVVFDLDKGGAHFRSILENHAIFEKRHPLRKAVYALYKGALPCQLPLAELFQQGNFCFEIAGCILSLANKLLPFLCKLCET